MGAKAALHKSVRAQRYLAVMGSPPYMNSGANAAGSGLNTTEYTEYLKGSVYSDLNTLTALVFKSEYFLCDQYSGYSGYS